MTRIRSALSAVVCASALAACGGGGSGGNAEASRGADGAPVQASGPSLTPQAQAAGFAALTPHVIVDSQGWGRPLDHARMLVPVGWTVRSEVRWHGVRSCGAGTAEPVVLMTSPDGGSAIEIGPTMQFSMQHQGDLSGVPPEMRALVQASQQDMRTSMARSEQQYRQLGDGCHVGPVNSALEAAQRYVLPWRRPGARIVAARPIPQTRQSLQAMVQQTNSMLPVSNVQNYTDAVAVDVEHANPPGSVERISFGVIGTRYSMPGTPMTGGGQFPGSSFDTVGTTAIVGIRAPRDQFSRVEALAATVLASYSVNPQWQEAMNLYYAEMSRLRAEGSRQTLLAIARRGELAQAARERAGEQRLRDWNAGQVSEERRVAAFIDRIYDSTGFVDPQTGARTRVPDGQQAFSNGRGGMAVGPAGSSPGPEWTPMQEAPRS